MPQELPGFYYDAEKNRYFPIKGPIPGTSRQRKASSSSSNTAEKSIRLTNQVNNTRKRKGIKFNNLLQARELDGNLITTRKGKFNLEAEYQKKQASQPVIWKYRGTKRISYGALEHINIDVDTPGGPIETDILLTGGLNGSLCLYEVHKLGQEFNHGVKYVPDPVWPNNIVDPAGTTKIPGDLWRPEGMLRHLSSDISCIKACRQYSPDMLGNTSSMRHVLITTLGSELSGGSVYVLNVSEPLDRNQSVPIIARGIREVTSLNCTIWTADCNSDMSTVAVGTNLGAALVNMETRTTSWVCRCKSDILSLQIINSGNIILCGLRNGAVVTVDSRQKPEGLPWRVTRHRIPYPPCETVLSSSQSFRNPTKQWFELKGCINPSRTISMPSSISCLASLKLYDQYFLASSMDGSIKLYDHRIIQKGAIQSYEGNVNTHTRLQLGIDPSEKLVMSGGEDCYLRLWSFKSGELLFENKFMDSVPSVVCWPRTELLSGMDKRKNHRDERMHYISAWLGSYEGLFYMHSPY